MKTLFHFGDVSLRKKLTLIITLTSSVVLLLACGAFAAYDRLAFRKELALNVSILAQAIGKNCEGAIDFNDPEAATETLSALRANPNIDSACVYSRDGKVFAVYQRNPRNSFSPPPMKAPGIQFVGKQLEVFHSFGDKNQSVGTIYVAHNLQAASMRLIRYIGIVFIIFVMSLLAALGLSHTSQQFISDPILKLTRLARAVAGEKNYSLRAAKQSHDEIGELVDGFNEMLDQIQARDAAVQAAREDLERRVVERTQELEITHKQLVDASRRGGMAEIATNVLHNVGNVLNSVNISASLIQKRFESSKASGFAKVAAVVREHEHDFARFVTSDPRGKHLATYLSQFSEHFLAEQSKTLEELQSLRVNIEHIKEIVAMQQSYAAFGAVREMVDLRGLIEDALRMDEDALGRDRINVVRELSAVGPINCDKHKLLQILINLIRNAKDSCRDSDRADKRLIVRLTKEEECVRISVIDNGVGISPDNLTRVFNHGFTTKKGGHGFGLHSGSLAAHEMGGSLTAHSDGIGKGARFTLELPCSTPEASNV